MSFVPTQECSHLGEVTDKIKREKIRFIDESVKLKGGPTVELRPGKAITHLSHDHAERLPVAVSFNPAPDDAASRRIKALRATGGLLEFVMGEVGCKPDRTRRRRGRGPQRREAVVIQ
jgi:hypothetical protein